MKTICIVADSLASSRDMIGLGQALALTGRRDLVLYGPANPAVIEELRQFQLKEIRQLPDLNPEQGWEAYEEILKQELVNLEPELILFPASSSMRHLAARLAEALGTGLASDCYSLEYDHSREAFTFERLVYGGGAAETIEIISVPAMATLLPGLWPAAANSPDACPVTIVAGSPESAIRIISRESAASSKVSIGEARVVVCAGRGFEKAEDLELARRVADLLKAELACTRPLSEELCWLPAELCVGLSGQKLTAEVCIELGISGQVQHLTGIKDCRLVASINKDPSAPIFKASDYGIAGDLYDILPRLIAALERE